MGGHPALPVVERRHRTRRKKDRWSTWVKDWHNGVVVIIALLAAALFVTALSLAKNRTDSIRNAKDAIAAAEHKDQLISNIQDKIDDLTSSIDALKAQQSQDRATIARLTAERDALQQQVINLRQRPVVPVTTTTRVPTQTSSTTVTRPPTTTTTSPPPTTTTTACRVNVLGRCVGP